MIRSKPLSRNLKRRPPCELSGLNLRPGSDIYRRDPSRSLLNAPFAPHHRSAGDFPPYVRNRTSASKSQRA